jgi:hypothetical protein
LEFKLGRVDNDLPDGLANLNKNFFFARKFRRRKIRRQFDLVTFGDNGDGSL